MRRRCPSSLSRAFNVRRSACEHKLYSGHNVFSIERHLNSTSSRISLTNVVCNGLPPVRYHAPRTLSTLQTSNDHVDITQRSAKYTRRLPGELTTPPFMTVATSPHTVRSVGRSSFSTLPEDKGKTPHSSPPLAQEEQSQSRTLSDPIHNTSDTNSGRANNTANSSKSSVTDWILGGAAVCVAVFITFLRLRNKEGQLDLSGMHGVRRSGIKRLNELEKRALVDPVDADANMKGPTSSGNGQSSAKFGTLTPSNTTNLANNTIHPKPRDHKDMITTSDGTQTTVTSENGMSPTQRLERDPRSFNISSDIFKTSPSTLSQLAPSPPPSMPSLEDLYYIVDPHKLISKSNVWSLLLYCPKLVMARDMMVKTILDEVNKLSTQSNSPPTHSSQYTPSTTSPSIPSPSIVPPLSTSSSILPSSSPAPSMSLSRSVTSTSAPDPFDSVDKDILSVTAHTVRHLQSLWANACYHNARLILARKSVLDGMNNIALAIRGGTLSDDDIIMRFGGGVRDWHIYTPLMMLVNRMHDTYKGYFQKNIQPNNASGPTHIHPSSSQITSASIPSLDPVAQGKDTSDLDSFLLRRLDTICNLLPSAISPLITSPTYANSTTDTTNMNMRTSTTNAAPIRTVNPTQATVPLYNSSTSPSVSTSHHSSSSLNNLSNLWPSLLEEACIHTPPQYNKPTHQLISRPLLLCRSPVVPPEIALINMYAPGYNAVDYQVVKNTVSRSNGTSQSSPENTSYNDTNNQTISFTIPKITISRKLMEEELSYYQCQSILAELSFAREALMTLNILKRSIQERGSSTSERVDSRIITRLNMAEMGILVAEMKILDHLKGNYSIQ